VSVRPHHARDDIRRLSRVRLPRLLYDYIEGGGFDEGTVRRNREDLDNLLVRQRVMVDAGTPDMSTTLLGQRLAMPLVLAPVGIAGMMARRGEAQAARACAEAGVPLCISTFSLCPVEEVARAGGVAPWFQLYPLCDLGLRQALVDRALAAECEVLVVTVDVPTPSVRYRETRRPLEAPPGFGPWIERAFDGLTHPRWFYDVYLRGGPHLPGNLPPGAPRAMAIATPEVLAEIRKAWPGRMVVKGILDPEDARTAVAIGADAIVVSNHGGRQLDGVRSSIAALGPVVDAVAGRAQVLVDGGFASGLDLFKALAVGADGCLIGRAWVHALAAGGEAGVRTLLARIARELAMAMLLAGRGTIGAIDRTVLDQVVAPSSP